VWIQAPSVDNVFGILSLRTGNNNDILFFPTMAAKKPKPFDVGVRVAKTAEVVQGEIRMIIKMVGPKT
jgi:hypothetical protein